MSSSLNTQQSTLSSPSGSMDQNADKNASTDTTFTDTGGSSGLLTLGWREWVELPGIGLPGIKAKVDTGARTSALHAFDAKPFQNNDGTDWVEFSVLPIQRDSSVLRRCSAPLVDVRSVTDSGGHSEERFCISADVTIGPLTRNIEITLASREDMLFRMLLGRTALIPGIVVDPQLSYTLGRLNARSLYNVQHPEANL